MQKNGRFNGYVEKFTRLPYATLFLLWLILVILFGFGYLVLDVFVPHHGPSALPGDTLWLKYLNGLYFSVITATSTGYGDIVPLGLSKALASIQSISALMIFATFVTKLVSHNQNLALKQIHRLTFETQIHTIREGLYIIRKDCDRIVEDSEENCTLTDDHWRDLTIIYRQAQSLLQQIPDFYEQENHLYTIDQRKEQLLHEGVSRTLHRINGMLDLLSSHEIEWAKHEESFRELNSLLEVIDTITPLWKEESPYDSAESFEDILHVNGGIHERVRKMLN